MKGMRKYTVGEKLSATIWAAVLVILVFSDFIVGIYRFLIMVFLAFVGIPYMWYVILEEDYTDQDGLHRYPVKITQDQRDLLSDPYRTESYLHPDLNTFKKRLEEKKEKHTSLSENE